jgi:hypothetical protein
MEIIKSLYRYLSPRFQSIFLDYKVNPKPRFGQEMPPHSKLYSVIEENRNNYKNYLEAFLKYIDNIKEIRTTEKEADENQPSWNNGFLPGLDIISLYGIISELKPKNYIEIGSGNSTKVARKAISDQKLSTKITSIDPFPRANIDHLADTVIRKPLEDIKDLSFIIDALEENDILFIDNSHRCFPNSDVTVCFLELLPYLKKGVVVQVHDVYLPYDYPQFMCDRFYNEQYLLAAFILANPEKYKTIFPAYFISEDPVLNKILNPLWASPGLKGVEKHGGSYWFKIDS